MTHRWPDEPPQCPTYRVACSWIEVSLQTSYWHDQQLGRTIVELFDELVESDVGLGCMHRTMHTEVLFAAFSSVQVEVNR